MTKQWKELKESIIEMRDSDGTGTQQEVCGFLVNLMEILEKQMGDSDLTSRQAIIAGSYLLEDENSVPDTNVGDTISRQAAIDALDKRFDNIPMELTTEILGLRRDLRELIPSEKREITWDDITEYCKPRFLSVVDTTYLRCLVDHAATNPGPSNWIPVSERLPEDIRPVIVTWKNNDPEPYYEHIVGKHFIGFAHYLNGKWYWYSSTTEDFLAEYGRYECEEFDEAIEVIAWMPPPSLHKGGKE